MVKLLTFYALVTPFIFTRFCFGAQTTAGLQESTRHRTGASFTHASREEEEEEVEHDLDAAEDR
ncbi:signal peptide-containing protein [Theileria equi strain WA]|uniref:Signal peptide-containing protein n=1 Tax=Theileria equi strain WA TaxID=1537102 RepID=L0AY15_THEEQ|nr:signal peptide-containing protein [Theileria equi strain WA]AFZ80445.1 signal peptide-containing protein [Theileria equi strain WA]|eukprot:XP_004830111.1 signal peptide-containing protein [Theileria equi strain WA]